MQRRQFLAASLATSALTVAREVAAQAPAASPREYYQIRRYQMRQGPQTKLTESYFGDALIPALTRMGMGPIGAFQADVGDETPAFYVLIPSASVEALAQVSLRLAEDAAFLKIAEPFWNAPATAPAFERVETSLLLAFAGWPKLTPPPTSATKSKRIFQMRTYESPSDRDHVRKVEMFNNGEFECFMRAGFHPVFFGDMLIGPRMPSLTYMLSLSSLDELNARWDTFRNDPGWKRLSADPRYSFEPIVSNISNLILSPLAASQI
ncbi:MAG: NIPSNAP family protein [Terracidiphilus sp.]|jgi:hypothetical protein